MGEFKNKMEFCGHVNLGNAERYTKYAFSILKALRNPAANKPI